MSDIGQAANVAKECGIGANCCICYAAETTCFTPSGIPEFCGQMSSSYNGLCCKRSQASMCIMPGHPAFEGLAEGDEHTCCILLQLTEFCVKPRWLDGTEPIYKQVAKGGCCTSRTAFPRDDDAPGRCSICGCLYLGCEGASGCCPTIPSLPPQAFTGAGGEGYDLNYSKAEPGIEYLCCALPCPVCAMFNIYIPDMVKDAFGFECEQTSCCFSGSAFGDVLPERDGPQYEELFLKNKLEYRCVKPTVCIKSKMRMGFTMIKCALPHDEDVPLACSCCGVVLCGATDKYQSVYCGTRAKPRAIEQGADGVPMAEKMNRE